MEDEDCWSDCGVDAVLSGKDNRPFSAMGWAPDRPDGTRVKKFDSPKNSLLPSGAAAADVPVTAMGAVGEDGAVDAGFWSEADFTSLVPEGFVTEGVLDNGDCDAGGSCFLEMVDREDSSFMVG